LLTIRGSAGKARSVGCPSAFPRLEGTRLEATVMQQLDRIHAASADGFTPAEALSSYLAMLQAMPQGICFGPKLTVAIALIDNIFAMDELKLEKQKLRRTLNAAEAATYDLLLRIGLKHAQILATVAADETHGTRRTQCSVSVRP
jgi:hypothetical protein